MPVLKLSNQNRLYYLDDNSVASRVILLLHGLGADSSSWAYQTVALINAGFRVIAPDAPGFGRSSGPRRCGSIRQLAGFIPSLLDHLKIASASLVGISMGGTLALQAALDAPERVEQIALVNTFARLDLSNPRVWPYYLARFVLVHTRGLPAQANAVAMRIFPAPEQEVLRCRLVEQSLQVEPAYYRSALRALAKFNVRPRLNELHLPAVVITGELDTTIPLAVQRQLAQGIPNARHVFIPHSGHAVSIDQPHEFNRILLEFLLGPPQTDYTGGRDSQFHRRSS